MKDATGDLFKDASWVGQCLSIIDASHLFIGLAGFVLTAETFVLNDEPINFPLCLLVGLATVAFYGLHRLVQIEKYRGISSRRMMMLENNKNIVFLFSVTSILLCLVLIWFYFIEYWQWLISLAACSLFYFLPLFNKGRRLRDLPFIKIFLIALAWPMVTIGLPYLVSNTLIINPIHLGVERFLFFIAITLPFDVRDQTEDDHLGVKTLANRLSTLSFNVLAVLLILAHTLVIWMFPFEFAYALSLQILGIIALISLFFAKEESPLWYFTFVVDGLMIGRFILFGLFTWFF